MADPSVKEAMPSAARCYTKDRNRWGSASERTHVILHGRIVEQVIDRDDVRSFVKEIVVTGGTVPLAMVRKRARSRAGGHARARCCSSTASARTATRGTCPRAASRTTSRARASTSSTSTSAATAARGTSARGAARGVEDYVREDLPTAVEEVQALSGKRPRLLVGHSLGGLVSYAAAPALAGAVAGIVSIGSPYHFTRGSLSLRRAGAASFARARRSRPLPNAPLPLAPGRPHA